MDKCEVVMCKIFSLTLQTMQISGLMVHIFGVFLVSKSLFRSSIPTMLVKNSKEGITSLVYITQGPKEIVESSMK